MKKHKHHTIPVASNIDWHLKNLFNDGFKTIVEMNAQEHINHHKTNRVKMNYFNKEKQK